MSEGVQKDSASLYYYTGLKKGDMLIATDTFYINTKAKSEYKDKKRDDLLVETLNPDMGYFFRTSKKLYETRTKFQDLEIHELPRHGLHSNDQ